MSDINADIQSDTLLASKAVKLTVALPREAVDAIEMIADRQKKTKTQVLREAIALKTFVEDEVVAKGGHLLIEQDGATRQIVFT